MKKGIGIGVEDFSEVIKENCYYIDKTKWIGEILEDKSKIKLFIRPRRFGKTLNMSMLKYFFNVENKEENRKLFNGLDVEKSEYMSEQGQYLVIFISLKSVKAKTWEEAIQEIRLLVLELFSEYKYLLEDLDEYDLPRFKKYLMGNADFSELKNALLFLTRMLFQKYKKEVILLIDEYDSPLISAYEYHYYSDAIAFFKVFYGEALKTNQYLKMGVMTGIIRVIKAGIFSDLNNLRVYSILDRQYPDFFGFNGEEVEKALKDFDIEYKLSDVKLWYNGYKFGNSEVYNPWSILNFLKDAFKKGESIADVLQNITLKDGIVSDQAPKETPKENKFKPIQATSKSQTYVYKDIKREFFENFLKAEQEKGMDIMELLRKLGKIGLDLKA